MELLGIISLEEGVQWKGLGIVWPQFLEYIFDHLG